MPAERLRYLNINTEPILQEGFTNGTSKNLTKFKILISSVLTSCIHQLFPLSQEKMRPHLALGLILASVPSAILFSSQIAMTLFSFTTALAHLQKFGALVSRFVRMDFGRRPSYFGKARTRRMNEPVCTYVFSIFTIKTKETTIPQQVSIDCSPHRKVPHPSTTAQSP
jgi:hypothetical protein